MDYLPLSLSRKQKKRLSIPETFQGVFFKFLKPTSEKDNSRYPNLAPRELNSYSNRQVIEF